MERGQGFSSQAAFLPPGPPLASLQSMRASVEAWSGDVSADANLCCDVRGPGQEPEGGAELGQNQQ